VVKIIPLGGANEVGASSTYLNFGGFRVLVDCGIRPGKPVEEQLPDLARIQEEGGLDAIVVTHAHTDHSGALPLVAEAYPDAPIYATHPTAELLKVLLYDSLRIMDGRFDIEREIPLYPESSVDSLLKRIRPVHYLAPLDLKPEFRLTFSCAGHILGAAMVVFETSEGTLMMTGDIHAASQRTVPPLALPRAHPQVLLCESTYGGRLHADREAEEKRLAESVAGVIGNGGKVLIPAFAVGRAQEVALLLRRAMAARLIPRFPIWLDGMVTAICGVYAKHPDYLSPVLSQKVAKGSPIFFDDNRIVRRVDSASIRDKVIAGGPCCIIASSGMLSGGASTIYARQLLNDPKSMISFTGYQDEESPGRNLLRVADGHEPTIRLDGDELPVRCRVTKYSLSAHADSGQLVALINRLNPQEVLLVHGDAEARQALSRTLRRSFEGEIHLPSNGDVFTFDLPRSRRQAAAPIIGVGNGRPLDTNGLQDIWAFLQSSEATRRQLTLDEILQLWHGYGAVPQDAFDAAIPIVTTSPFFKRNPRRPFVYALVDPKDLNEAGSSDDAPVSGDGRIEQNRLLSQVAKIFNDAPDLYRTGVKRDEQTIMMYFHFPEIAQIQRANQLAQLAAETGWTVKVHPETHQGALNEVLERLAGDQLRMVRSPSIYRDAKQLILNLEEPVEQAVIDDLGARLAAETGWTVSARVVKGRRVTRPRRVGDNRSEINQAFALIDRAFNHKRHRPYKKSKKSDEYGEFIELAFITPEVGKRYSELVRLLERETRWRMRLRKEPNTAAINSLVQKLIPQSWGMRGGASLHTGRREVRIRLTHPPQNMKDFAKVAERFLLATGYRLLKAN